VIILDTSTSMGNGNTPGTPLYLAKAAANSLLNSTDATVNSVMVVNFGTSAAINTEGAGVYWTSKADAVNYITGLGGQDGYTNYDAALNTVMSNWGSGPTAATQTLVYFISDGQPTLSISNPNNATNS